MPAPRLEGRLMTFAELRDSIRATRDIIYLNTGFTGPSPSPVVERIHEVLQQEAAVGGASPEGLQLARAISREAQEAVAGLLNVDAADVLITHGTTEGLHVVIYGMSWKPGDELVTCDLEHPALATPASVLEQRFGVIARRVQDRRPCTSSSTACPGSPAMSSSRATWSTRRWRRPHPSWSSASASSPAASRCRRTRRARPRSSSPSSPRSRRAPASSP